VEARPALLVLAPGGEAELAVKIVRNAGFDEAVQVAASDFLAPNMGAAEVTIAKDKDTAPLKLSVPGNVPPGEYTLILRGTGSYPFQKNPKEDKKDAIKAVEASNPIRLLVRKP
jgi:hypothetical protein